MDDCDVTELQALNFIWPQTGVRHEENEVMERLAFPSVALLLRLPGAFAGSLVELPVFFW
jgi:hypothetical protein